MDFIEIIKKNKESDPEAYEAARSKLIHDEIRKIYSPEDEFGIQRQKESKPDKFKKYDADINQCIARVDELLGG